MSTLLEKVRKLNAILQQSGTVNYDDLAKQLSDIIDANIYIISQDGSLLGMSINANQSCEPMSEMLADNKKKFEYSVAADLEKMTEPNINCFNDKSLCHAKEGYLCPVARRYRSYWPIVALGKRLGTLIVAKFNDELTGDDIVLCEYAMTIVSVVGYHRLQLEEAEIDRKRQMIRMGFDTLSYSEMEAVGHVFTSLNGKEGILVASKIADKAGITRSVIVNALRKLESAGLIETRSLGMKGTFIKIQNELIFEELNLG
ncbi:MAG: GTP-sensing pleiotropic transcriptional regulator CodY [Phascolarctobacterium sp.]|nr:GTP-sensing pleiotropic transcriptional regulator CodY [Phascolarctobacterium sp.]